MTGLAGHILDRLRSFPDAVLLHGNAACIRDRWTAAEIALAVEEMAAGFTTLGVKRGTHVGLIADNFDLWLVTDLSLLSLGAVDVPRAADTSHEELGFVLEHSECEIVVVESESLRLAIQPTLESSEKIRETVVLEGAAAGKEAVGYEELRRRGREALKSDPELLARREAEIDESDLATIVYTSGTTGNPKGVMLTHGNILHNVRILPALVEFTPQDSYISFLPTWHTFERTLEYSLISAGTPLHYSSKLTLRKDLRRIRPTVMAGVPRLWESMVGSVTGKIAKAPRLRRHFARLLLSLSTRFRTAQRRLEGTVLDDDWKCARPGLAERCRLTAIAALLGPAHTLAERLVYSQLAAALGGRIRFVVSGGGALPPFVDEFITRAGILLLNGYGLTETAPVVSLRDPRRNVHATSGRLLPETTWRVMDEEARSELGRGAKGVLWIKGPQVMRGYFKNREATDRVLADGWFCSGDLAILSNENDVIICGRAKDTIVLRGGENVEPEVIEAELSRSPLISDVVVVGHGEKHLAALVVPDVDGLAGAVPRIVSQSPAEIASNPSVHKHLHREVVKMLSPERGFRIHERVPRITCIELPFCVEDGTLTATLKKKRRIIEDRYTREIGEMFGSDRQGL